jgi:hypothetical protein
MIRSDDSYELIKAGTYEKPDGVDVLSTTTKRWDFKKTHQNF